MHQLTFFTGHAVADKFGDTLLVFSRNDALAIIADIISNNSGLVRAPWEVNHRIHTKSNLQGILSREEAWDTQWPATSTAPSTSPPPLGLTIEAQTADSISCIKDELIAAFGNSEITFV